MRRRNTLSKLPHLLGREISYEMTLTVQLILRYRGRPV